MRKAKRFITVIDVQSICKKRGIENPHELHLKTGVEYGRVNRWWNNKGVLKPEDYDILCDTLPCAIKDIIYRKEVSIHVAPNTPNMSKVIGFIGNQNASDELQAAIPGVVVLCATDIDALKTIRQGDTLEGVVIQIRSTNDWITFEFLNTAHPSIPRFAILSPETNVVEDLQLRQYAEKFKATAVFAAETEMKTIANVISGALNSLQDQTPDQTSKDLLIKELGEIWNQLQRLGDEYNTTAMRTLPQPVIGADSLEKLSDLRELLQNIRITP
jgi:hypothetical protein